MIGPTVRRQERDLRELLSFFSFPRHLWKKVRTTNTSSHEPVEGVFQHTQGVYTCNLPVMSEIGILRRHSSAAGVDLPQTRQNKP